MTNRENVIKEAEEAIDILAKAEEPTFWMDFVRCALENALVLLKEQKAKYPVCEKCGKEIDHINTSVFNYDGSDSDYSIPITYNKESGCVSFSTSQQWTGYDLTDEEQKERICCPYCGKFPFDDSTEIEFYEPVEVMMWTSESR